MLKKPLYLEFLLNLSKAQAIISRRFDSLLGGLGFNEFVILHAINDSSDKMRRVDLAEKIGLTASGVTRLLLPMEKIGLIKREVDELDGRVSYVIMTAAGKKKLFEAIERVDFYIEENMSKIKPDKISQALSVISELFLVVK